MGHTILRWERVGNFSFILTHRTGNQMERDYRVWGESYSYFPICGCVYFSWQGAALITKHLVFASRAVEASPVVLGKDSRCFRSPPCSPLLHTFLTPESHSDFPIPPLKWWPLLETSSILSTSYTLIESHCILYGFANNNFMDLLLLFKKTVASLRAETSWCFHFVLFCFLLIHITVPVNQTKQGNV